MVCVTLSSLPGITFIEHYVTAGFEGQFPKHLQVQFKESKELPTFAKICDCDTQCSVPSFSFQHWKNRFLFGHSLVCVHMRIKVCLHKSNVCAKPPAPSLPCREFPILILGCSVHSKRDGAQVKCLAKVPVYNTSNKCLNNPGFSQFIALYLFADRLLAEFWGKEVFVVC